MHDDDASLPDEDRSAKLRRFYAQYVTQRAGADDPRLRRAFATVPKEPFAGPPPWFIIGALPLYPALARYTQTPDGDPSFLYQDVLVALDRERGINMGDPGLHAFALAALAVREGETVLHIGCGSGYYSAILSNLVGPNGHIHAFEIDAVMAARARDNILAYPNIKLHVRSGAEANLPGAEVIYVNAAFTFPVKAWLDALAPGGRLLFPLQQVLSLGAMLLIEKPMEPAAAWPARFITRAIFIAGQGSQSDEAGRLLDEAFEASGAWQHVRSLRFDDPSNKTCWLRGKGWWLSSESA